jgi:hypothetical protein
LQPSTLNTRDESVQKFVTNTSLVISWSINHARLLNCNLERNFFTISESQATPSSTLTARTIVDPKRGVSNPFFLAAQPVFATNSLRINISNQISSLFSCGKLKITRVNTAFIVIERQQLVDLTVTKNNFFSGAKRRSHPLSAHPEHISDETTCDNLRASVSVPHRRSSCVEIDKTARRLGIVNVRQSMTRMQ